MNRIKGILVLTAGVLLAGAALAQPPGGAGRGPGGPGGPGAAPAIAALMTAQNITETTVDPAGRWTVAGRNGNDIRFWAILGVKDPSGEARVALRYEYLSPTSVPGGVQALSRMDRLSVDCAGQRVKVLSAQSYPQHNFTGTKTELGAPNAQWEPAASRPFLAGAIQTACSQSTTSTAATSAAPFDVKDERARRRWMADNHINEDGVLSANWQLLGVTPQGIFFAREGVVHYVTGASNTPLLIIREERFQPVAKMNGQGTTLSETVTWEVNCTSRQIHRSQVAQYEARNLAGTSATNGTPDGWIPATQNAIVGSVYQETCANANIQPLAVKERPQAPDPDTPQ